MTQSAETEHLEFKEAKETFKFPRLCEYCVAFANERGGRIVLGVTDARPRRVVGSNAFGNLQEVREHLFQTLKLRVETEELFHPDGRVVIFQVPSRPVGKPIVFGERYLMRVGENLVGMTPEQLQRIFAEALPDYSADTLQGLTLDALDELAIEDFRSRWIRKSGNDRLTGFDHAQLLADAGVMVDGKVTVAALVLFGKPEGLARYLPQAEVVFEYRSSETTSPPQQRENFRQGFFGFYDRLWGVINLRNDRQSYQDGFFRFDIATFEEVPVREAVLNAVCHRDYQSGGSVFVRQYPRRLDVVSPGGFPTGVTPDNVLDKQLPRNRCIAEALEKCGFVERSGQGMNLIFESAIRAGKALPDFAGTDAYQVAINLHGEMTAPAFVRYLEKIGTERTLSFGTADFLVLAHLHRGVALTPELKQRLPRLVDLGVIERSGRTFMLSRGFYDHIGQRGTYTRKKGLDHETNKSLLLKHIKDSRDRGSPLSELQQVHPNLSPRVVQRLLQELRVEGRVALKGARRWARWYVTEALKDKVSRFYNKFIK